MIKTIPIIIVLLICIPACSQKSLYTNIQENQRYQCQKLPESERESCLASIEMDYEEYQRQRTDLVKEPM